MSSDVGISDLLCFIQGLSFDPFGNQAGRRDGGTTAKSLELGIFDNAIVIDLDLQLHYISTCRGTNKTSSYVVIFLIK